jgi:hypothetical protein
LGKYESQGRDSVLGFSSAEQFGYELDFCKVTDSCYKTVPLGHSKWLSMLARNRAI